MKQSEARFIKSQYTHRAQIDSLQSQTKVEKSNTKALQVKENSKGINPSLQETKCYSTFLESQKSFTNQNSQLEQKSSLLSAQFKEINSQQNFNFIDNYCEMSRSRLDNCLNQEEDQTNFVSPIEKNNNSATKSGLKANRSQSINCCTFGRNKLDGEEQDDDDNDDDNSQDFMTSLLNATRISRENRAKLRSDLIQSNILQNKSFNNDYYQKKGDYDNDMSEEDIILPTKGKSILISINNSILNQSRNQNNNNIIDAEQQQIIMNLIEKCCQDYDQQQKSQQFQFPILQLIPNADQSFDQKNRRRSSSLNNQIQATQPPQNFAKKVNTDQISDNNNEKECKKSNDIILATTQSLPSIIQSKQFSQNPQENQKYNQNQLSQDSKLIEKLNQTKNYMNDETEYYDEDYYLSNQKDLNQKHDIKFHKSFFNTDTPNNNSKNRQQSSNYSIGRSREFTDNHLGFTEINHFTTEIPSCIIISEKNNKQFDQEDQKEELPQPNSFLKSKVINTNLNDLYLSNQADLMRLSTTTYEQQTVGGAISLQAFMQTKQNVFLQDWVQKRSSNILVGWQKRWLVLKNKKLQYFKTDQSAHYQGCIDFSILTCTVQKVENKKGQIIELRIKVEDSNKTFRFQASKKSSISLEKWAEAIQNQINYCTKYKLRPHHITQQREFWKKDRICLNEFESLADTGDLILFKGMTFGEKVVRNLINCEYNHIGLILRTNNDSNNLLILEATGDEGVGILSWKTFLHENWQELYHKISLRKLIIERTDEILTKMESFIRYAIGKEYGVSFSKLFKKRSNSKSDLAQDPNRTFFCSELIATIYKICGLLPLDISSGHYWPSSFEGSRNLKLTNNASLSEEFIVDFEI
ncbi:hypothetical protein ABPG72_019434 [Tetrahymena utriculariae]